MMNKCSEKLPEMGKDVLTMTQYGTFNVDYLTLDGWYKHRHEMHAGEIVCWWKLPERPKDLLIKVPA